MFYLYILIIISQFVELPNNYLLKDSVIVNFIAALVNLL